MTGQFGSCGNIRSVTCSWAVLSRCSVPPLRSRSRFSVSRAARRRSSGWSWRVNRLRRWSSCLSAGVLADRFSRDRLMVGSDLIAFVAQGADAGLFISGTAPLGLIAALSAVAGAASGIFYPASRGLIPQIVDGPHLQSANALIRLSQNAASMAGAAVSGVIIMGVGAGCALGIDAASFLVSAGLLLTSRAPRARRAEAA